MGSLYGYEVESDLPLRRLNRAPGTRGSLLIAAASEPLAAPREASTSTLTDDDGRLWFASYELSGRCLLEMPPSGKFLLEPSRCRVLVEGGGDPDLLEHRIASSAVCTLLAMRADVVLHASAVEVDAGAVVFCGATGRGKSTLVSALGGLGHPVLGEDGIAIGLGDDRRPTAFPGARGVRIRRRGGASPLAELLPDPGPREPPPLPVAAVVALGERRRSLEVEALPPARALVRLTSHLIHSGGRGSVALAFDRLARLLHSAPAFSAALPDQIEALPGAAQDLLDRLPAPGPSS